MNVGVIVVSTRPGRVGLPIAQWFAERAKAHGKFDVHLIDLAEVNLPIMNEPNHPRLQQYQYEPTKKWSEQVKAMDAFVWVMPEYNYFPAPAMVNAIDYLFTEWHYKPAAFVSYGGVSGGLRAQQAAKLLLTAVKMVPLSEAVIIPFFNKLIADGKFAGSDGLNTMASGALDELHKWATALKTMR